MEDCLSKGAATETDPNVPPKGVGEGIEIYETIRFGASWLLRGWRGTSLATWEAGVKVKWIGSSEGWSWLPKTGVAGAEVLEEWAHSDS